MSKTNYCIVLLSLSIVHSLHGAASYIYKHTVFKSSFRDGPFETIDQATYERKLKELHNSREYKQQRAREREEEEVIADSFATRCFILSALTDKKEQAPETIQESLFALFRSALKYTQETEEQQIVKDKQEIIKLSKKEALKLRNKEKEKSKEINAFFRFLRTDACLALITSLQKSLPTESAPEAATAIRITEV